MGRGAGVLDESVTGLAATTERSLAAHSSQETGSIG